MSTLYVDNIAPKTVGNKVIMPQGGIIQTQHTMFTGTNPITCTTNTDVVLTDLTVNITPQSSSSVIKLEGMVNGEWNNNAGIYQTVLFFFRDTTKLSAPTAGNRNVGVSLFFSSYNSTDTSSTAEGSAAFQYYDTPNTTSQITYKIGMHTTQGGNPILYLNRTVSDTNNTAFERFISLISATEIAG